MLTERVFPVVRGAETHLDPIPMHPVRVEAGRRPAGAVWWTHPFLDEMIGCLLLDDDVTAEHYLARYEWSRGVEPVQHVPAHASKQHRRRGRSPLAFGRRWERTRRRRHERSARRRRPHEVLVEEFGYSEEIVALPLPPDDARRRVALCDA